MRLTPLLSQYPCTPFGRFTAPSPPFPLCVSSGLAGGSPSKGKKLRLSMASVKAELVAGGINSAGAYEYLRQPTDLVVLGKIRLTPAAQHIKVGPHGGGGAQVRTLNKQARMHSRRR